MCLCPRLLTSSFNVVLLASTHKLCFELKHWKYPMEKNHQKVFSSQKILDAKGNKILFGPSLEIRIYIIYIQRHITIYYHIANLFKRLDQNNNNI